MLLLISCIGSFLIGGFIGFLCAALLVVASDDDELIERP